MEQPRARIKNEKKNILDYSYDTSKKFFSLLHRLLFTPPAGIRAYSRANKVQSHSGTPSFQTEEGTSASYFIPLFEYQGIQIGFSESVRCFFMLGHLAGLIQVIKVLVLQTEEKQNGGQGKPNVNYD